jgi:cell division protein FtsI (penicillin-binding protein 3)
MLELVVKAAGPHRALRDGLSRAGKTGTAHKLEGQLTRRSLCFDVCRHGARVRSALVDRGDAGRADQRQYYGGVVAAPVFSRVMSEALRMLSVTPDAPLLEVAPSDAAPEVREEV